MNNIVSFSDEEIELAIQRAVTTINKRSELADSKFVVKYNDCFAFTCMYDEYLRGHKSKIYTYCNDIHWETPMQMFRAMVRNKMTFEQGFSIANYQRILDNRPALGDIGIHKGSLMVSNGTFWITSEGKGVFERFQQEFYQPDITHIYRPRR